LFLATLSKFILNKCAQFDWHLLITTTTKSTTTTTIATMYCGADFDGVAIIIIGKKYL